MILPHCCLCLRGKKVAGSVYGNQWPFAIHCARDLAVSFSKWAKKWRVKNEVWTLSPNPRHGASQSTSVTSTPNKSVITSSSALKYQSVSDPPVSTSFSPASFSTLIFAFSATTGEPTPDRRLAMRLA